jgi:hypothetical protein
MSGGIYEGPNGELLHGDGTLVGRPVTSSPAAPAWFTDPRCEKDNEGFIARHRPRCRCGWMPALHLADGDAGVASSPAAPEPTEP